MARTARWTSPPIDKGVYEVNLSSWKYFSDYINQELLQYKTYVFRGHANSKWKLEPTLDRAIKTPSSPKRAMHLQNFKYSVRGRRGNNPPNLVTDNDWWALGQHHGLNTPLLDWTESPFVALFFAASGAKIESSDKFSVFALSQGSVNAFSQRINENKSIPEDQGRKPIVEIIRPLSDENNRLVNQRGLFTRGPNNIDLEAWTKQYYQEEDKQFIRILKINIPKSGIDNCLKYLNRMNINHATLFPDLEGASKFCNTELHIPGY